MSSMRINLSMLTLGLLFSGVALAQVPPRLGYQGRLLRADGTPEPGPVATMSFTLYETATGGIARWSETQSVGLSNGYYSVQLGAKTPFPAGLFDGSDLFLEIAVAQADAGVAPLSPRQRLASVAYAQRAGQAVSVSGGVVDATIIRVNGTTVIDSSGALTGPASALASVSHDSSLVGSGTGDSPLRLRPCSDNQVLVWRSATSSWECSGSACSVPPTAGTASATYTVASTCTITLNVMLNLAGAVGAIQWEKSTDLVTWTEISGATSNNYATTTGVGKTYYQARVTSCGMTTYSNVVSTGFANQTVFTSSGTWVVPAGVTRVLVETIGPGGYGGAACNRISCGSSGYTNCSTWGSGGGGGGGGYARSLLDVTASSYAVTVSTVSSPFSNGCNTSFGSLVSASPGSQGAASCNLEPYAGGAGGTGSGQFTMTGATGQTGTGSVGGQGGAAGCGTYGGPGSGGTGQTQSTSSCTGYTAGTIGQVIIHY